MAKAKKKSSNVKKTAAKKAVKQAVKKSAKTTIKKAAKKEVKKAAVVKTKMTARPKMVAHVKSNTKPRVKPSVKTKSPAQVKATPLSPKKSDKNHDAFFQSFLKPLDDRLVVVVGEGEKRTPGGLYIPETATDDSGNFKGKVMAIGRGHMNKKGKIKPLDVSVGDNVVFSQFSGSKIEISGGSIMVIRESDILGILK